ncbi:MAG: hypothetical protein EAZ08_12480 [Cytophagales bacterium]|nr:MAG: hypothetical protein EAZ08_12480 [Cytophagales bacterium]
MKLLHIAFFYLGGIFLLAYLSFFLLFPNLFYCQTVYFQEVDEILPNVYVSKKMKESDRKIFLTNYDSACKRIVNFFGSKEANSRMIVGSDGEVMQKFGNQQHGKAGMTHFTPVGTYIVIDKEGLNIDVISHELAHAELFARIGWKNRTFLIPTWFDEGIAMLLDNRFIEMEEEWQFITLNGKNTPNLGEISTPEAFFGNQQHIFTNYLTAKSEVQKWYARNGKEGLKKMIDCIDTQGNFKACYEK